MIETGSLVIERESRAIEIYKARHPMISISDQLMNQCSGTISMRNRITTVTRQDDGNDIDCHRDRILQYRLEIHNETQVVEYRPDLHMTAGLFPFER